VGLRCPAHPAAQALLQAAHAQGVLGLAAPSANRFGRVSPTTAAHVVSEFADMSEAELLVLDGGACAVGIESTIVDLSRGVPVLLRPGQITPEQLQAVCGQPVRARDAQAPRASGTLESHYAPSARVRLMDAAALAQALHGAQPGRVAVYARVALSAPPGVLQRAMPEGADAVAHEVFAVLRALDASGVAEIWVEAPPAGSAWDGVRDRLTRAAA
jgi:L-threonylcarbamoyladenylate synthase